MSDSYINELEDSVWDEFLISDDYLAPYPKIELNHGSAAQTEGRKKPKHDVGITSNIDICGAGQVNMSSEKSLLSSPKIKSEPMFVDSSLSHSQDAAQSYDDLMASLSSESPTIANRNIISNYPIENCTTAENSILFSLSDRPQSVSDFSFLYNGLENKETDDPLFYEWSEIGNFEDVDCMFRTCDSAFGLGDLVKEDEICWFSSSTEINGYDTASRSEVRSSYCDSDSLKNSSEISESTLPNYESRAIDAFTERSVGPCYTSTSPASHITEQSCLSKAFSVNDLPSSSDIKDRHKPLKKVHHVKNNGYHTESEETNVSLHHFDGSKPPSSTKLSLSKSSQNNFVCNDGGLEKQNESSNKNSQLDEISLEATSFHQLQEVMEQLDLKTKLFIRDSLYRLARNAEQRNGAATIHLVRNTDESSSEAMSAETKHAGLFTIETDTNPIDRIIAHLLFHRPTDLAKKPPSNTRLGNHMSSGEDVFLQY